LRYVSQMNQQSVPSSEPFHAGEDSQALRQTLGCFPTGVTIVTTLDDRGEPIGLTVSSFNSVSLTPPLILWSLQLSSTHLDAFRNARGFAVSILSETQADICSAFASDRQDRFNGIAWTESQTGMPLISGASAWLECETEIRHAGGDHDIFIGRVLSHHSSDAPPLIYARGRLAALAQPQS